MGDVSLNRKENEAAFAVQQPDYSKAERLALDLLEKYHVEEPPIVAVNIARKEGLKVRGADFSELLNEYPLVSGFINPKEGVLYVNKDETSQRQNFTIAHELGHYVLGHTRNQEEYADVLFRLRGAYKDNHFTEKEANAFAANLLMPRKLFQEWIYKYPFINDYQLSGIFGVSLQAVQNRREYLKL